MPREWVPLFEVASRDLDSDAPALREVLADLEALAAVHGDAGDRGPGCRLDSEAQFAMGWWFYAVHAREWFVRGLVGYLRAKNPRARGERAVLDLLRGRMEARGSGAKIKLYGDRSVFAGYWSWLMR